MGSVCGSDGKPVLLKELMEPFRSGNALTLAGKPKLFFIQACQGSDNQRGVMIPPPPDIWPGTGRGHPGQGDRGQSQVQGDSAWISHPEVVPNDADFLIGTATIEEFQSFRDTRKGSIYIQALCKQLERAAKR